jgi:uncharacterized protein
MAEPLTLSTDDGVALEAELARPRGPGAARAGCVLCHPHPQFGGSMHSLVIGALFGALPDAGATTLRFNFRGVGGSTGSYGHGDGERHDVESAVAQLASELTPGVPLVLAGWSFGADMALSVRSERLSAWLAIAPPLASARDLDALAVDPRPKLVVLAQHDEFRDPTEVEAEVARWANARVEIVGGASHFFVGRTDRVAEVAIDYVDRVTLRPCP